MHRGWKASAFVAFFVFSFFLAGRSAAEADTTPPETIIDLDPTVPDGENGWYLLPVGVTLTASDLESGVKSINWRLNEGDWQSETFPPSLNLAPNPSFEEGVWFSIDSWDHPYYLPWRAWLWRAPLVAKFDSYSAAIVGWLSGSYAWNNRENYIVASPWEDFTVAVWLKTSDVSGAGASFKIYGRAPAGDYLLAESEKISGTTDWTRLAQSFQLSLSDAYGIFLKLNLSGTGTVWFDGVSVVASPTDTLATFTISQNGQNSLEYYSLDQADNEELPHQTAVVKIDTVAPSNWRDFAAHEAGGDHTLWSEIKVDDPAAGLDDSRTFFQYSVDGGVSWGYFEDLLDCHSSWNEGAWSDDLAFPGFSPGDSTMTINTPPVDFCNSNWSICKILRFKTGDLAGNESTKDVCIYGAWAKAEGGGDVYGGAGITMSSAGAEDNSDALVSSGTGVVENFVSSQGWLLLEYSFDDVPGYDWWRAESPPPTLITTLPSESGYFLIDSDFTIASSTIPPDLGTAAFGAVVFINGSLTVNSDYTLGDEGAIIFIVKGDVSVDKRVENMAGYFIVGGDFDSAYNGGRNTEILNIRGGAAVSGNFWLRRSLKDGENESYPAERLVFEPKYFFLFPGAFETPRLSWQEVSP